MATAFGVIAQLPPVAPFAYPEQIAGPTDLECACDDKIAIVSASGLGIHRDPMAPSGLHGFPMGLAAVVVAVAAAAAAVAVAI